MEKNDRKYKEFLEKHIRPLVLCEIKRIIGSELIFPENPTRYYKTRFERLADNGMLNEGLIRTYPLEWVEKYVTNRVNSDFVKGGVDEDDLRIWFVLKPYRKI